MEAVRASHTTGEDYDVCLVDRKMTDMDGHLTKPIDPERPFQMIETSVAGAASAACAG